MKKTDNKCNICMGHGWWPMGMMSPIGPMDASEWPYDKIVQCPECKAGGDNKSDRYKELKKMYEKHNENKK